MHTVLVLGAGASKAHNPDYPTGDALVQNIAAKFHDNKFLRALKRILYNNIQVIKEKYPGLVPPGLINAVEEYGFLKNEVPLLSDWVPHLSGAETIDDFLYHRKEYSILAKIGIFHVLSEKENPDYFCHDQNGDIKKSWYNKFWEKVRKGCKTADELFKRFNYLTIITFNYDRTLDYFIYSKIHSLYQTTLKRTDFDNLIKIHHVYGSLGGVLDDRTLYGKVDFFTPPTNQDNPFFMRSSSGPSEIGIFKKLDEFILTQSLKIKTYNEETIDEVKPNYWDIIDTASHLYFFGFAFHPQNMDILFPSYPTSTDTLKKIHGTCFGMDGPSYNDAIDRLITRYPNLGEIRKTLEDRKIDIDMFLNEYGIEIAKTKGK